MQIIINSCLLTGLAPTSFNHFLLIAVQGHKHLSEQFYSGFFMFIVTVTVIFHLQLILSGKWTGFICSAQSSFTHLHPFIQTPVASAFTHTLILLNVTTAFDTMSNHALFHILASITINNVAFAWVT